MTRNFYIQNHSPAILTEMENYQNKVCTALIKTLAYKFVQRKKNGTKLLHAHFQYVCNILRSTK